MKLVTETENRPECEIIYRLVIHAELVSYLIVAESLVKTHFQHQFLTAGKIG